MTRSCHSCGSCSCTWHRQNHVLPPGTDLPATGSPSGSDTGSWSGSGHTGIRKVQNTSLPNPATPFFDCVHHVLPSDKGIRKGQGHHRLCPHMKVWCRMLKSALCSFLTAQPAYSALPASHPVPSAFAHYKNITFKWLILTS